MYKLEIWQQSLWKQFADTLPEDIKYYIVIKLIIEEISRLERDLNDFEKALLVGYNQGG